MFIAKVRTKEDEKDFLKVPLSIYKNDTNWVQPLDHDINIVFDKQKNAYFQHGEAVRWILKDDEGKLIGRIAAFVNEKTAHTFDQPTGGIGFFECIDNKKAAFLMFDTAKAWLVGKGMEAMDGPINFGEKDKWWGLMVQGFSEAVYCSNYNPPYYRELFESYGFKTYYEQYYYQIIVNNPLPAKFQTVYNRVSRNTALKCIPVRKREIEKFTEDFRTIYNRAWVKHDNFKEMSKAQAQNLVKGIKPIMDENLIWFAYHNEDPIGFFVMLPELNRIIRHFHGKFGLLEKLKFNWYRWKEGTEKIYGVVFGVTPEWQGKGIEALMIIQAGNHMQPLKKYGVLELTWIGDFNPKMISLVEMLGSKRAKTYITYRKLFDESKPFQRAPLIQ